MMTEDATPVDNAAEISGVKDATVKDKDAKTPEAPKPQDSKVSSSTPGSKTETAKDAKQSPDPALANVIPPSSKAGNSDVRQRTSASRFEYTVSPQELATRQLEVMVKNDTSMFSSSQKKLGVIAIDLSEMYMSKAITDWYGHLSVSDMAAGGYNAVVADCRSSGTWFDLPMM